MSEATWKLQPDLASVDCLLHSKTRDGGYGSLSSNLVEHAAPGKIDPLSSARSTQSQALKGHVTLWYFCPLNSWINPSWLIHSPQEEE